MAREGTASKAEEAQVSFSVFFPRGFFPSRILISIALAPLELFSLLFHNTAAFQI